MNGAPQSGPLRIDPKGLYPLEPFAAPLGAQLPVFTTPQCWEEVIRYDPFGIIRSMYDAVARALVSDRADKPSIEFRAWIPPQEGQRKAKRVRLGVTLYQMTEGNQVWIELKKLPGRSKHGRLAA